MNRLGDIASEEAQFVISDIELILDVVDVMSTQPDVNFDVIIPDSDARQVKSNFPLNAKVVALTRQDRLSIYATETDPLPNLLVDGSELHELLRFGSISRFSTSTDEKLSKRIDAEFEQIKSTADPIEPDILSWSDLLSQLKQTVGGGVRSEFERLIEAARIDNIGALDDVSVALVSAAQAGALQSDISEWAADVGFASKATFSRRKNELEDEGIIRTEKVPIDVGRPKLRLLLFDNIDDVGVHGEELEVSRKIEQSSDNPNTASESSPSSQSQSAYDDETTGDEELQILEEELKEAISPD